MSYENDPPFEPGTLFVAEIPRNSGVAHSAWRRGENNEDECFITIDGQLADYLVEDGRWPSGVNYHELTADQADTLRMAAALGVWQSYAPTLFNDERTEQ